jgi:hypothetical protein
MVKNSTKTADMKKIVFLVITVAVLLGINACCKKPDCTSAGEQTSIYFYNFSENEMDKITLVSYMKNSNFTIAIDSTSYAPFNSSVAGKHYVELTNALDIEQDYKIKLDQTGQHYTLSGFQVKQLKCKGGCGLSFLKKGRNFDRLVGYDVNGKYQEFREIAIYK